MIPGSLGEEMPAPEGNSGRSRLCRSSSYRPVRDATFEVGDATIQARAGDYVFGPRDIPHRYAVGDAGCRVLFIMTPGGFEDLVLEMSEPAGSRSLPPPSDEEPDWERIAAIAEAHGNELLM